MSSLPGLPGAGPRPDPAVLARVKGWVRSAARASDDDVVMVTVVACAEPDCPPVETVLAVLRDGRTESRKLHQDLGSITEADVVACFDVDPDPD